MITPSDAERAGNSLAGDNAPPRFRLGRVVATPGALRAIAAAGAEGNPDQDTFHLVASMASFWSMLGCEGTIPG